MANPLGLSLECFGRIGETLGASAVDTLPIRAGGCIYAAKATSVVIVSPGTVARVLVRSSVLDVVVEPPGSEVLIGRGVEPGQVVTFEWNGPVLTFVLQVK